MRVYEIEVEIIPPNETAGNAMEETVYRIMGKDLRKAIVAAMAHELGCKVKVNIQIDGEDQ